MAKKMMKPAADPPPPPKPQVKGQIFIKIICPYCRSNRVRVRCVPPGRGVRYYECLACVATDSGQPTTFKVQERTHEQAQGREDPQEGRPQEAR